ncbi:MAG: anaerobic dehydrogenase [Candidatus Carbobacillus altaicus]|uniref:Anaerobic dehydrogenase n=1 Tax=Candidatus Carbonibacillus altaicus TaxID=2163959 RepID=A0A2R6XYR3_9BACL|nr:MAG: anaerobic dehydrogenase [Candidatus Carbobacillus altaicus]
MSTSAPYRGLSQITAFLAAPFLQEPTLTLYQRWYHGLHLLKDAFSSNANDMKTFFPALERSREQLEKVISGTFSIETARQDFYDIFFVPYSNRYQPPIESVVRYQTIWGKPHQELSERYQQNGFDPYADPSIYTPFRMLGITDMLGFELAYLAYTLDQAQSIKFARDLWLQEARSFLSEHIIPFLQSYHRILNTYADDSLYAPWSTLTYDMMQHVLEGITSFSVEVFEDA